MNLNQYNRIKVMARTQAITWTIVMFCVLWFLGLMLCGPMTFWERDAMANYWNQPETTIMPDPGLVHIVPEFQGVELIVDSPSIVHENEYGDVALWINTCWLTDFIGVIPAAPNPLLDGVVHNDTVANVVNIGSIIYGNNTPLWDELVAGAPADVLTMAGGLPGWAAPVVQTSTLLDGAVHTDTAVQGATLGSIIVADATPDWNELLIGAGGDVLTVVGGTAVWQAPAAVAGVVRDMNETAIDVTGPDWDAAFAIPVYSLAGSTASDVQVWVRYRVANSQTMYNALSAPSPVADQVTYYWVENAGNNLEVHVANDTQSEIYVTASYVVRI